MFCEIVCVCVVIVVDDDAKCAVHIQFVIHLSVTMQCITHLLNGWHYAIYRMYLIINIFTQRIRQLIIRKLLVDQHLYFNK